MDYNEVMPELYDHAMKEVKNELLGLREDVRGVHERLDVLNGTVKHHEDLLWGDSDEPGDQRRPGIVDTVRNLKDLADKAYVVLNIAKWVFGFIGVSLLLMFLQNLLSAISVITTGTTVPMP